MGLQKPLPSPSTARRSILQQQGDFPPSLLVQVSYSLIDPVGLVIGSDHAGQHVPLAGIDPRRERPAAAQHIATLGLAGAAGGPPSGAFHRSQVELTNTELRGLKDGSRLIPGMTVAGDIMVGKRTILSYLVEGAMRTGSARFGITARD